MQPTHEPGEPESRLSSTRPTGLRTAVIIHNFLRPQNLPRIVSACLRARHRPDVFVIDNALDDSLAASLRAATAAIADASARLTYRANFMNRGSGDRYSVAAGLDHDAIASIDDDLFLTPAQVDALLDQYLSDTSRIHGVWGERLVTRDGQPFMINAIFGREVEVDILNRAYAFAPTQARQACELLHQLGYKDWMALGPGSDIILSFSGEQRPLVHDVGGLESCETSGTPGIASWRREGFQRRRFELFHRLMRMRPRPTG